LACASVTDCVAPTICDSNKQCVNPAPDAGSDDGCSVTRTRRLTSGPPFAWLGAVAALLLARRRRRRRSAHTTRLGPGQATRAGRIVEPGPVEP
jgi:hypothetical protein